MSTFDAHGNKHQSAGRPDGGRFATQARAETGTTMLAAAPRPPVELDAKGFATVFDTSPPEKSEHTTPDGFVIHTTKIKLRGDPWLKSRGQTLFAMSGDRQEDLRTELADLAGSKVQVAYVTRRGDVMVREGTAFGFAGGRVGVLRKRSKTEGVVLSDDAVRILSVHAGWGKGEKAVSAAYDALEQVPATAEATFDQIPTEDDYDTDGEPPNEVAAAYLLTHPGFGEGEGAGCVFFATDRQIGDGDHKGDIINGYLFAPSQSGLFSEHGSMYSQDLKDWGGSVETYEPGSLTFAEAMALSNRDDQAEIYRALR